MLSALRSALQIVSPHRPPPLDTTPSHLLRLFELSLDLPPVFWVVESAALVSESSAPIIRSPTIFLRCSAAKNPLLFSSNLLQVFGLSRRAFTFSSGVRSLLRSSSGFGVYTYVTVVDNSC